MYLPYLRGKLYELKAMHQDSLWTYHLKDKTFEEIMKEHFNKKVARILLPDEIKL